MVYTFPSVFPKPVIPSAGNSGNSYQFDITDSTISTTTDANYKITRPRTTRVIHTFTYTWTCLSDDDFNTLKTFWETVRTSESFSFANYADGKTYMVRFSGSFSFKQDYPHGWYGSLTFEEV